MKLVTKATEVEHWIYTVLSEDEVHICTAQKWLRRLSTGNEAFKKPLRNEQPVNIDVCLFCSASNVFDTCIKIKTQRMKY